MKRGKRGWKQTPHLPGILWESSEEEHHLSDLISLSVPMSVPPQCLEEGTQMEEGPGYHPASTQMDGGAGYHPALKLLQSTNQARVQLEYELIQETQELAERYKHKWAKQARRHARWQTQMINQTDGTFQEVFSQASLTESIKLLPWCISVAVPFCYISRPVTIAAQQDEGIPTISNHCPTASEPEPHGSLAPGPSGGLTPPPGIPPLPVSSLPDIPLADTPLMGCPFPDFLVSSIRESKTILPAVYLTIITSRGPVSGPQKLRLGSNPALLGWLRHTWIGSGDWTQAQFWTRRVGTCQSFQPL